MATKKNLVFQKLLPPVSKRRPSGWITSFAAESAGPNHLRATSPRLPRRAVFSQLSARLVNRATTAKAGIAAIFEVSALPAFASLNMASPSGQHAEEPMDSVTN